MNHLGHSSRPLRRLRDDSATKGSQTSIMGNELELTFFGSPEVRLHGLLVTGFRSSKAQALFYYLAVTGRPHSRSTLAGLLWGDQPEVRRTPA